MVDSFYKYPSFNQVTLCSMHSIVTTFREAVIKVEVANFGAAMDTLIDQDGWCKAKPILIYQGVHCCINVCYLHLDIVLSSQVVSLHLKSVIHGGCKLLCSNGHLDRSRCLDICLIKSVNIEYLEQGVTCLHERVFIKTMHHLLTNCSQSILSAMVCRQKPIGLQAYQ